MTSQPPKVPPVLQQKCAIVKDHVAPLTRGFSNVTNGKILVWRGEQTKYFWTIDAFGKFSLYHYAHGVESARVVLTHRFAQSETISHAVYYPASERCHGVAVAVSDLTAERGHYVAYFSLRTLSLLKCYSVPHPITGLLNVVDGTASASTFQDFCQQFHSGWRDILLVGCRAGQAYLFNLGVVDLDAVDGASERRFFQRVVRTQREDGDESASDEPQVERTKPRRTIPLTKMFLGEQMFLYHADNGHQVCVEKEKVYVSALHYLEKSKAVMIGFSFGGVLIVSLATSKIVTTYFGDGSVKFFAVQEPEEDPRPLLYYWACLHTPSKGPLMILSVINYPKDEAATKNPAEFTYLEPVSYPILKWYPENCSEMISVRTLFVDKRKTVFPSAAHALDDAEGGGGGDAKNATKDSSLTLMVWQHRLKGGVRIHGSLFDLNAFYAKRLTTRVVPDNTVARQYAFLSRFSSDTLLDESRPLDAFAESVFRFPPPAFLKDSIDQLFYPSTFFITFDQLTTADFVQMKVSPIQVQLVSELTSNVESHFENPTQPAKWIFAVGLANSAPAASTNEERACLLRVLIHIFMPGVMRLITASKANPENIKFIQRWIWKEIELTKTKFDDLCSPLFADPPMELSPNARGYIHHARAFFQRASLILEALSAHVDAFEDAEWKRSICLQYKAARQVEIFSLGIAFGICFELLPLRGDSRRVHTRCVETAHAKWTKAKARRNDLQIRRLVAEMMRLSAGEESLWHGLPAEAWFPPEDFASLLPILLLINVPESAKISLFGYYCLEYGAAGRALGVAAVVSGMQKNLFEKCCSFFMQDSLSLELQGQIYRMWYDDNDAAEYDARPPRKDATAGDVTPDADAKISEEELYWLPLCTRKQIKYARAEYLKHEHGVHLFNRDIIEKRRYNLIIEPPPPTKASEPAFVTQSREKYAEIRAKFPWLFMRVEPLPAFIVNNFRKRLAREARERRERKIHVATRKRPHQQPPKAIAVNIEQARDAYPVAGKKGVGGGIGALFDGAKRRKLARRAGENGAFSDEEDGGERGAEGDAVSDDDGDDDCSQFEELPLTIATPAKRQRLMLFSVATPTAAGGASLYLTNAEEYDARKPLSFQDANRRVPIVERLMSEDANGARAALTNIGRSPFVVDSPMTKHEVRPKDWERVNRLIQTPLSLKKRVAREDGGGASRIPIRLQGTATKLRRAPFAPLETLAENGSGAASAPPTTDIKLLAPSDAAIITKSSLSPSHEFALPPPTPASILKTDKKKSKITVKTRLRFENEPRTEHIPSRAENLMEENRDNSFSNFGVLTESSCSSAALDDEDDSPHQERVLDVTHTISPAQQQRHLAPLPIPCFEEQDEQDVSNDWGSNDENENDNDDVENDNNEANDNCNNHKAAENYDNDNEAVFGDDNVNVKNDNVVPENTILSDTFTEVCEKDMLADGYYVIGNHKLNAPADADFEMASGEGDASIETRPEEVGESRERSNVQTIAAHGEIVECETVAHASQIDVDVPQDHEENEAVSEGDIGSAIARADELELGDKPLKKAGRPRKTNDDARSKSRSPSRASRSKSPYGIGQEAPNKGGEEEEATAGTSGITRSKSPRGTPKTGVEERGNAKTQPKRAAKAKSPRKNIANEAIDYGEEAESRAGRTTRSKSPRGTPGAKEQKMKTEDASHTAPTGRLTRSKSPHHVAASAGDNEIKITRAPATRSQKSPQKAHPLERDANEEDDHAEDDDNAHDTSIHAMTTRSKSPRKPNPKN